MRRFKIDRFPDGREKHSGNVTAADIRRWLRIPAHADITAIVRNDVGQLGVHDFDAPGVEIRIEWEVIK